MHLVGYLYEDCHDAGLLERKASDIQFTTSQIISISEVIQWLHIAECNMYINHFYLNQWYQESTSDYEKPLSFCCKNSSKVTLCEWHKELKTMSGKEFHVVETWYTVRFCAADGNWAGGDPQHAQWFVIQSRKWNRKTGITAHLKPTGYADNIAAEVVSECGNVVGRSRFRTWYVVAERKWSKCMCKIISKLSHCTRHSGSPISKSSDLILRKTDVVNLMESYCILHKKSA
jgi:hypothetical protein